MSIAVSPETPNGTTLSPFQAAIRTAAQNLAIQLVGIDRERLKKAYTIALTSGAVKLDDDADGGLVTTESGIRYVNGQCPCEDPQRHGTGHWCKHRLSVELVKRTKAALMPVRDDRRGQPTPVAPALPEAPASVNVRVVMAGREVQVTLRDTDEQRLLARLARLLEQYPVADSAPSAATPPADPAAASALPVCPLHGVPMKPHSKNGESWHSHKHHGGWCRGRAQA